MIFSSSLGALVYGLIRANAIGWGATEVLACFGAAVLLLVVFIALERRQTYPMLDLGLLRVPTFVGGLVAAFAVNGSIFSLLTYLTLYQQNILGYSALSTGLLFLTLTGALFLISGMAGRMTSHVPVAAADRDGFLFIGLGLFLMRPAVGSGWTALIPGFIFAGIGAGLVNTPLASTAVGVVEPARAGMASGINSTLRQVGTATGVAALGSLLATQLRSTVTSDLAHTTLASGSHQLAQAISQGAVVSALHSVAVSAVRRWRTSRGPGSSAASMRSG